MRLGLVDRAVAVEIARDRHRLAVGAGSGGGPIGQRAGGIEVGEGYGAAAIAIDHGDGGLRLIEHAGAGVIEAQRPRQSS